MDVGNERRSVWDMMKEKRDNAWVVEEEDKKIFEVPSVLRQTPMPIASC